MLLKLLGCFSLEYRRLQYVQSLAANFCWTSPIPFVALQLLSHTAIIIIQQRGRRCAAMQKRLDTIWFKAMIVSRLFRLLVLIVRVAVGNPSQVGNDKALWSTAPQSLGYSINLPNESSPALNSSSENMSHRCDPLYGIYPDIGDCQDALARLQSGSTQRTFGQRAAGLPDTVIILPLILFGSMQFTLPLQPIHRALLYCTLIFFTSLLMYREC